MTAITINIPNHEVSFFKKVISKMSWTYSETDVVQTKATPKEQAQPKLTMLLDNLSRCRKGKLMVSMLDADGLLQFVDKDDKWIDEFVKYMSENYYGEMWTVSCNGKIVWPESAVKPEKGV